MRERFLFCRLQHHFTPLSIPPSSSNSPSLYLKLWVFDGWYRKQFSLSVWLSQRAPALHYSPELPVSPGQGGKMGGREEMIDGVENEGYQKTSQKDRMGMDWEFKSSTDVARRNRFNVLIIISLKQEKWATLFRGTTKFQRKSERWKEKLKKVPKTKVLLINGATG